MNTIAEQALQAYKEAEQELIAAQARAREALHTLTWCSTNQHNAACPNGPVQACKDYIHAHPNETRAEVSKVLCAPPFNINSNTVLIQFMSYHKQTLSGAPLDVHVTKGKVVKGKYIPAK